MHQAKKILRVIINLAHTGVFNNGLIVIISIFSTYPPFVQSIINQYFYFGSLRLADFRHSPENGSLVRVEVCNYTGWMRWSLLARIVFLKAYWREKTVHVTLCLYKVLYIILAFPPDHVRQFQLAWCPSYVSGHKLKYDPRYRGQETNSVCEPKALLTQMHCIVLKTESIHAF